MLYTSIGQIMNKKTNELIPEFTFDTDLAANDDRMVWRHYFEDGTHNTRRIGRIFHACLIYHIQYIEDKNPDRLQQLVDSGELYDYLMDLYDRVEDAVTEQTNLWTWNDPEYKAISASDPIRAAGIRSMYELEAQQLIYAAMIYD